MSYQWSPDLFAEIYNAIKFQPDVDISTVDLSIISHDLTQVLKTPSPSTESRNKLNAPLKLSNGDEVQLNEAFTELSVLLATELDLDEVCTAELLFYSEDVSYKKGTSLSDSSKLSYFSRGEYILNILIYLVGNKILALSPTEIFDNAIESFNKVYKLIDILNDLIDKQKVTGDLSSLVFINGINFARSQLFKFHELLGTLLYALSESYFDEVGSVTNYEKVIKVIKSLQNDDVFVFHFLPFVLNFYAKVSDNSALVDQLYTSITKSIPVNQKGEVFDLAQSQLHGFEIVTGFIFLTEFIPWCKCNDTKKYDFQKNIITYMESLISVGVMELLLSYCAETSTPETRRAFELSDTYDFRSLLQRTVPPFAPKKFIYQGAPELLNLAKQRPEFVNAVKLVDISYLTLNPELNDSLISPLLQHFFSTFVADAALILTSLRDSEEDFALSFSDRNEEVSDDSDDNEERTNAEKPQLSELDEIAQRADLERFYLAFAYTYNNRPELCSAFWTDESNTNEVLGFLSWGLNNNTSPLIAASFSVLLASLSSGGSSIASKIWDILINNNSHAKKNDYSKISIDSIFDSLNYYIESLNNNFEQDLNDQLSVYHKRHELVFSNKRVGDFKENGDDRIVIELAEDSIISISGFVRLISSIMLNLSGSERADQIKNIAFNRFLPIIKGFLEFDNLINGGKVLQVDVNAHNSTMNPSYINLPDIHVCDDSRIVLLNLIFQLLGNLAENNSDSFIRYESWRLLDRWMYHGLHLSQPQSNDLFSKQSERKKYTRKRSIGTIEVFANNLTHYSQVLNFADLVKKLLQPLNFDHTSKYTLAYPCDLGYGHRPNNKIGIWPYIEFLLVDVLGESHNLTNEEYRDSLQTLILQLCVDALHEVDWEFLSDSALNIIRDFRSFESIFDSLIPGLPINYDLFVKLHHSLAVLACFFNNKVYNALFKVIDHGVEAVNASAEIENLVSLALNVLNSLLGMQNNFRNHLLPVLTRTNIPQQPVHRNSTMSISTSMNKVLSQPTSIFDNIYQSKILALSGVKTFYDVILFNLSSVAHIALFVNCDNPISRNALKILSKLGKANHFRSSKSEADPLLSSDRLLTTFLNIDESEKIKFAFIDKFEEIEDTLEIKFEILDLLASLLDPVRRTLNIAHFLLGFEIKANTLNLNESQHTTLLDILLATLRDSLNIISELDFANGNRHVIDVGPAKLSSLILEILIKLCSNPVSSGISMNRVRDYNLVEKLINFQPKLDLMTSWCGYEFDGDLGVSAENYFISSLPSIDSFTAFIMQRELALKLLSLEFYNAHSSTQKDYYSQLLLSKTQFPNRTARIIDFLDVLNFNFRNLEVEKYDYLNRSFNVEMILKKVQGPNYTLDYSILEKIYRILCQGSNMVTPESKQQYNEEVMTEGNKMQEFVTKYLVMNNSRDVQLRCLASWCQLVLVLQDQITSSDVIIDVFNSLLPKVSIYLESDILFSEELVSLCVSLFDLYESKFLSLENVKQTDLAVQQLMPLFQTCISGVISSHVTPNMRSEFYAILNKFISKASQNKLLATKIMDVVSSIHKKILPILTNDALYSEGLSRINSIFLIESLLKLEDSSQSDIILKQVVKQSFLSQVIRALRRTDEVIKLSTSKTSELTFNELFVELTAFKANLYLLVKIAQSQKGALQLVQNELFATLANLNLLKVDPDLGLTLHVHEVQDFKNVSIRVLLDTPLSLSDLVSPDAKHEDTISLNELVVPVFELVTTVLLAMGPTYKPGVEQTKKFMKAVNELVMGVLKRDYLLESGQVSKALYQKEGGEIQLLQKLVRLFTVIGSIVGE
ncbi:NUP192 [Candida margitis]|uniref:NUP192 n=1 Tax=Candida margitis TaxID=1775924 RepID=UPI0022268C38|nr:NUP192 [Candida margitis]KAI5970589.1 NUP192 [Candida margitis]